MHPVNSQPLVRCRIIVEGPPAGVQCRLQEGRDHLVEPKWVSGDEIAFEFTLRVGPPRAGQPNFLGAAAQGPADARFVYINSGRRAGQQATGWDRRAKVPLRGITPSLLEAALQQAGQLLEARIAGRAKDGGPACATVPLLDGWRLAPASAG
jgi:hypothetical protein